VSIVVVVVVVVTVVVVVAGGGVSFSTGAIDQLAPSGGISISFILYP